MLKNVFNIDKVVLIKNNVFDEEIKQEMSRRNMQWRKNI
jgi:hypothetical protein